jgi:hypothetical protein
MARESKIIISCSGLCFDTVSRVFLVFLLAAANCAAPLDTAVENVQPPPDISELSLIIHYPSPPFNGLGRHYLPAPGLTHILELPYLILLHIPWTFIEGFRDLSAAEQVINEEVRNGRVSNPAKLAQESVVTILTKETALTPNVLKDSQEPFHENELGPLWQRYGDVTLLDIDTKNWGLVKDADKLRYRLRLKFRLLNLKIPAISWEKTCDFSGQPYSLEELAQDSAALLKKEVEKAAYACAQDLYRAIMY